jgi:hypothetical protein
MAIDIRLPNITATTESGQLTQMRSYLYQFAEQLQWALNTLEKGASAEEIVLKNAVGEMVEKTEEAKAQDTFNSIKDLIIKSADIVEAYYEEIDNLLSLSGKYVAESEFGDYKVETSNKMSATDQYIESKFTKVETIDGEEVTSEYSLADIDQRIRKQEGTIRYGNVKTTLTTDGETIGIEIGEIDTINDKAISRFATFSAAGVELYDGSTSTAPVVTISKSKITITSAEFTGFVKMGKYRLDLSNGIAFKWEEG